MFRRPPRNANGTWCGKYPRVHSRFKELQSENGGSLAMAGPAMIGAWEQVTIVEISAIIETPTQRLRALIASRLKRRDERRFASRVCAASVAALQAVRAERPDLKGDALYEAVVARRLRLSAAQARAVVWRAHESLVDWGTNRDPKLIDVVKYMIVSEYLGRDAREDGMAIDLGAFLSQRIDQQL